MDVPISKEVIPPTVYGKLRYTCCMRVQEVEFQGFSEVICEICKKPYTLGLLPNLMVSSEFKWDRGTLLYLLEDVELVYGEIKTLLIKGTPVIAVNDLYSMLDTPNDHTLVRTEGLDLS